MKQLNILRLYTALFTSLSLPFTAMAAAVQTSSPTVNPHSVFSGSQPIVKRTPTPIYNAPLYLGIFDDTYWLNYSQANAINLAGEAVGASTGPAVPCGWGACVTIVPFLWKFNTLNVMPTANANDLVAELYDINNSGVAVGSAQASVDFGAYKKAYYVSGGSPYKLSSLSTYDAGIAYSVNNNGVIVGAGANGNYESRAVSWTNGAIKDLGTLPGDTNSLARGINDLGVVVGQSYNDTGSKGVKWDVNGNISLLNTGGIIKSAMPLAINNKGTIVGHTQKIGQSSSTTFPVVWNTDGSITLLSNTHGEALDVNNHNQVVGYYNPSPGISSAFLWDRGKFYDLNDLIPPGTGWIITRAASINDKGEITGSGINGSVSITPWSAHRAIILKPKKS